MFCLVQATCGDYITSYETVLSDVPIDRGVFDMTFLGANSVGLSDNSAQVNNPARASSKNSLASGWPDWAGKFRPLSHWLLPTFVRALSLQPQTHQYEAV
jgi:hypothetical protein